MKKINYVIRKQSLIDHLGGTMQEVAEKLGFKDRQSLYDLDDPLTEKQAENVLRRMAYPVKRPVPKEWEA